MTLLVALFVFHFAYLFIGYISVVVNMLAYISTVKGRGINAKKWTACLPK